MLVGSDAEKVICCVVLPESADAEKGITDPRDINDITIKIVAKLLPNFPHRGIIVIIRYNYTF